MTSIDRIIEFWHNDYEIVECLKKFSLRNGPIGGSTDVIATPINRKQANHIISKLSLIPVETIKGVKSYRNKESIIYFIKMWQIEQNDAILRLKQATHTLKGLTNALAK